jgi:hypothetical protein
MTDIETRLERHAIACRLGADHVPDLAVMLRAASRADDELGASRPTRDAPRPRSPWWSLAAVVAVTGVLAALLATWNGTHHGQPSGHAEPQKIVGAPVGATVEREHSNELALVVEVPGTTVPCAIDDARARITSMTPTTVAVHVSGFTATVDSGNGGEGDPSCEIGRYTALPLRLGSPLGSRQLVDADSGSTIPVIDGRSVPAATYLPPGYHLAPTRHDYSTISTADGRTVRRYPDYTGRYDVYAGNLVPPIAERVYASTAAPDSVLSIIAGHRAARIPGATTIASVVIHGHSATIADTARSRERCITWTPGRGETFQVCSSVPFTANGLNLGRLLTPVQLAKVARGLK